MENEVVQKNGIVSKKFASHLSFLKEETIYKKLEGTGLCPKLLYSGDDLIEHSFIPGTALQELLQADEISFSKIAKAFKLLVKWYVAFYKKTGNILGQTNLNKFILTEDEKIFCVDFEHCKPGYFEMDLAGFVLNICLSKEAFSENSLHLARLFGGIGASYIKMDSKRFTSCFLDLLQQHCQKENMEYPKKEASYICTALNCCGGLFAEDPLADVSFAQLFLSTMPQKILVCKEEGKPDCSGFSYMAVGNENVIGVKTAADLLKKVEMPWCLWFDASERYPYESITALLSCEKKEDDVFIAAPPDSERIFPCLIRTQTAKVIFNIYPGKDLLKTLKKLKVRYIV